MTSSLADLTNRQAVLAAIDEFNTLGREAFLDNYGYGPAKEYFLRYEGGYYDSKAICGAAVGHQYPDQGSLGSNEFSGGNNTVKKKLNDLGFAISKAPPTSVEELWEAIGSIRSYRQDGKGVPHKWLLLLYACRTAVLEGRRSLALTAFEQELDDLIVTFSDSPAGGAQNPLWRLQFDGLWEVTRNNVHLTDTHISNDPPPPGVLLADGVTGALPDSLFELLAGDPSLLGEVFERVADVFSAEALPAVRDWFFTGLEDQSEEFSDQTGIHTWDDRTGVRTWGAKPRAWMVRGGTNGEDESFFFEHGAATVAWELPDPPEPVTDTWLRDAITDAYPGPEYPSAARSNFLGQLWPFMVLITEGDLIVTPQQASSGKVAIGVCTRSFFVDQDQSDPRRRFRINVDWQATDLERAKFGQRISRYLAQPRTVGWLDDDTTQRIQAVLATGSPRLYWWVNQRTSWEAEQEHACICAPRQAKNGAKLRHHVDVGRVQTGDVIVHYADGELWAVSEAMSDGHESIRPYELGADLWQKEVFLARCWYDRLLEPVPLSGINERNPGEGPFTVAGAVKQGYLWPLPYKFIENLIADQGDALRGTSLNPGTVWLFQANPSLPKSQFPQVLKDRYESENTGFEDWWEAVTNHKSMAAGDRVLFWFAGEQAGIYASGMLTGPPFEADLDPAESITKSLRRVNVRIDNTFYGRPFSRTDLKQHPVLKDLGPIKFANATNYKVSPEQWASYRKLWFAIKEKVPTPMKDLDQLSADLYLEPTTALQEIVDLLEDRKQAIFHGPPGTGKTRVALDLAEAFAGDEDRVELVQFHPSYAYEDFVEGWRPTEDGNFKLKPGPLRRLAKRAEEEESHNFVLVIDEINRANLSKVLGELFFLFEYRDHQVTLQYSEERFSLPKNLYILGTMNTADRSIAFVDAALRRRFHFHPFFPDRPPVEGTLSRYLNKHNPSLSWLSDVVDRANEKLADPDIAIGHSHFFRPELSEELIGKIWKHSILPYVEDQFFDDPDRVAQFTIDALRSDDTTNPEEDDADDPTN